MERHTKRQLIAKRITNLRNEVKLNTQQLRFNLITRLSGLFNNASDLARSPKLDLKERQNWMRIAAYIAQIIEGVSKGYDERQIDRNLDELQRLIDEARAKAAAGKAEGRAATGGKSTTTPEEPSAVQ